MARAAMILVVVILVVVVVVVDSPMAHTSTVGTNDQSFTYKYKYN